MGEAVKADTKQNRLATSAPGEASPHQLRASPVYQRVIAQAIKRAGRRADVSDVGYALSRPRPKFVPGLGHGRRNPMVIFIRAFADPTAVKQPGRRYGPPPESGNCNPGSPAPKGRRTAALAEKHARREISA